MRLRLYVVHGSHPCAAVEKALALKGLAYDVTEWPPPVHAPLQLAIFGARTVPGLKLDGEKVTGSRAIMRRLEQIAPDPPLFPSEAAARARVEQAEEWGDEVFQPVARELVWAGFRQSPGAMVSYSEHSRLPLPAPAIRLIAPAVARMGARLNRTDAGVARGDLDALPNQLDKRLGPEVRPDSVIVVGLVHDDDRARRVLQQDLRRAAFQPRSEAAQAARPDDDRRGLVVLGQAQDRARDVPLAGDGQRLRVEPE